MSREAVSKTGNLLRSRRVSMNFKLRVLEATARQWQNISCQWENVLSESTKKYFKDTLNYIKASLKSLDINVGTWEDVAQDCMAWRHS